MPGLLLIAASLISFPDFNVDLSYELGRPHSASASQQSGSAMAFVEFLVSPDGRIYDCKENRIVGERAFGNVACAIIQAKGLAAPTGPDGKPMTGRISTVFKLARLKTSVGEAIRDYAPAPDLELSVQSLPGVADDILDVPLLLAVDAQGKVADCVTHSDDVPPRYVEVACGPMANWNLVVKDESGHPVPYITRVRVRFVKDLAAVVQN